MSRLIVIALAFFALSSQAVANTFKGEADLRPFTESVMSKVGAGDSAAAFAQMKPFTVIPETEFDTMALSSKAQRDQVGPRYGKTIGYECLNQSKIGQSLVKITCIEKTEKHALPWIFYFYNSPNGWVLNSFFWNDKLPSLFPGA